MADTGSRNFRCPASTWEAAQDKASDMRGAGYDIDVTKVLNAELSVFTDETIEETAERFELVKGENAAKVYRKPKPRMSAK